MPPLLVVPIRFITLARSTEQDFSYAGLASEIWSIEIPRRTFASSACLKASNECFVVGK